MTLIESAKKGDITESIRTVAENESVDPQSLAEDIAKGLSVIPKNLFHDIAPVGIGRGLSTKINANIGTSKDKVSFDEEMKKLDICVKYGADAIMDLSTGGRTRDLRTMLMKRSPLCVGTVPIYEAVVRSAESHGSIAKMSVDDLFNVIEEHAKDGVDFVTVHAGLTMKAIESLKQEGRVLDIVSRGGAFLLEWMIFNERENPLYDNYDRLIELSRKYDLTLSLGDGLRPGCLEDATDRAQITELVVLGELQKIALENDVQVIIEGPGHVPIDQVELNIKIQKELCNGAPFYVLGPLVTDSGMGYDHISAAIGGTLAAAAGADFLCYVTPAEHIRLPDLDDVREGVVASKIAAHAADIAKGIPSAIERDRKMSRFRKNLDWEGQISMSFDPDKVRDYRAAVPPTEGDVCSMCGEFCAIRTVERALRPREK
ncbi:MAG: phosphomethylpyrimidine synthase ThiC [Nitrospirota bacterium]|nr:MAG: phosphomethylpyrimidine synthase ThiC [Nitrospirota bacterium]